MYPFLLHTHSGLRWLVILLPAIIIIKSIVGISGGKSYAKLDNILSASFVGLMHLQFLLGLILYFFFSPYTSNFSFDMKNADIRFWSVEHLAIMILAIAIAQIGRSKSKKVEKDRTKFKLQLIFFGLSLAFMIIGIPWSRV